jgi:hypothetical protein
MDSGRFDALTIALGGRRRALLRALVAGALAVTLPPIAPSPAGAACRDAGRPCRRRRDCCSNRCRRGTCRPCRSADDCSVGADCIEGQCVTIAGTCSAGADTCLSGPGTGAISCNAGSPAACFCFQTIGGATRCGTVVDPPPGTCVGCTADDQCVTATDVVEAFCANDSGPRCSCDTGQPGFCALPCPN